jgi:hypothetical protein
MMGFSLASPDICQGPCVNPRSIADTLNDLMTEIKVESVSVRWLLEALRKRAFGFLLLFLAIPNILPMPPGLSTIFGILLLFPAVQMIIGNAQPWFPPAISKRRLRQSSLKFIVNKSEPWLNRIEPLTHERMVFLTEAAAIPVLGFVCLVLALILMLPIFLGNLFPGLAIAAIAIGLIQKDGLFVLLATPFVAASLYVTFLNIKLVLLAVEGIKNLIGM